MKKFLLTILSLVALVATGYTTESRAATADALAVVKMTPESGSTVPNIYEILIELNKEVWYDFMTGYQPVLKNAAGETVVTFGLDYPGYTGMHQGTFGNSYLSKNVLLYGGPITEAGTYTLIIYGDSFKTDDLSEVFPRTEYTFTIGGEATPKVVEFKSVDPAEGEVTSLKKITIETDTEFAGAPSNVTLTDASGVAYTCTTKLSNTWCGITVTPSEEITTAGTYTLTIPAGALYSWADPTKKNEEKTFTWTVSGATPAITANWSMTEGQVVETFSDATIIFSGVDAVKATNSYGCYWLYEKDENGAYQLAKTLNDSHGYLDATASGTALTLSADPVIYSKNGTAFSRKGDYRIVIPAGGVYFNGDRNNKNTEEYVLNFKIENDFVEAKEIDAAFTAEPANEATISEIKEIVITFTEYTSIEVAEPDFVMGSNIPQVLITDPDFGMTMPAGYIMARAGAAANQLVLYVDPQYTGGMESYATPGAYTVMVPAGVVKFGQDTNKAFELNYTVSAEVAPAVQVVTFDFAAIYGTDASISNLQDSTPLNVDGFTMTFAKGNGSSGVVYNKEGNIRINGSSTSKNADVAGNTITIAAPEGKVITGMVFNPGTTYANYTVLDADQGNFTSQGNNVAAYWDGYASTVVVSACRNKFNPSQAKTGRYASVEITYVSDVDPVLKVAKYDLNGDNTDTFKGLDVTFNKDVQAVSALFGGGQTVIKNAAGETMGTCFLTAKGNKINAEFSDDLEAGNYSLVFPANTIKTTDGSIVLPETAIDFTIKAAKLDATVTFTTSPILASTGNATVKFDCAATNVEYIVTYDGTEPTPESYSNAGTSKQRNITLSTAKKDSICTVTVRAMSFDGVLSDCFTQKVFAHYAASLDFYRAATTMAAGNYLMTTPATIAYALDAEKTYGYLPSVDVASNNGISQAFNYFEWTFETADGGYYMKDSQGRYYYMTGNYNSFNISETVPAEGGVWAVEFVDGTAKVMNVAKQKYIQYNANYGTWGVYADAQGTMPTLAKIATPELVITPDMNGTRIPYNVQEMTFYCADGITLGSKATNSYVMDRNKGTRYEYTFETVDANTIKLALKEALPTGDFVLNLYKAAFTLGAGVFDMAVPASTTAYQFSIVNPYEVTVTPSNDSYVEKLDTLTFSNDLGLVIDNLYEGDAPSLSYNNGEETVTVKLVVANTTANAISFVPETALTTETAYTLNVAEGYFLVGEEQEAAPAIKKEYQLIFPVVIVSSTPAEGSRVEQFSEIVVEFNKLVNVAAAETYESYYVVDPAGNKTELTAEMIDPTEISVTSYGYTQTYQVAKKARFYAPEVLTAEGAYRVVFGNAFGGGDIVDMVNSVSLANNTTINFEVKVEKLGIVSTSITEGAEVEQFTEVIVNFNKPVYHFDKTATVKNEAGQTVATLSLEMLDVVGEHKPLFGAAAPLANKARLYASEALTTEGTYYVNIPADMFATDDNSEYTTLTKVNFTVKAKEVNPTITATWSIEEGVELSSMASVEVTFSGVDAVKSTSMYPSYFWEKNADGQWQQTENGCTAGIMDASASGATLTLSLDPGCYSDDYVSPFSRTGEYRVIIPVGGIYFNGDKTNKNTEEYVLNFTIKGAPQAAEIDAKFTANPANNSTIDAISNVVLTFTEYTSIEVAELDMITGSNIPYVYMVEDLTGQAMPAGYIFFRAGAAANQLELYVDPNYNGGSDSYNLAGNYMIRIPKKVVKFSDGVSAEIVLNYTVTGGTGTKQLNITSSDPLSGSYVEKLESVVVDWNMNIALPKAEAGVEAYVEDVHGIVKSTVKADFTGLAGNQIRYVLDTPISEAGIYNLIIPAGDVVDFDTETISNQEISLTYNVEGAQPEGIEAIATTPADGETVASLETVTVVFNQPVNYDAYFDADKAYVADMSGKVITYASKVNYIDGTVDSYNRTLSATVEFVLDEKVTEANTYKFVVPTYGIYDANFSMMGKDIEVVITVGGGTQVEDIYVVSSTPYDGEVLSSLSEILVTFNTDAAMMNPPYIYNADNTVASSTTINLEDKDGNFYPDNIACLELNQPLTERGSYYLLIAAGTVYDYPNYQVSNSQDIRINFEITSGAIKGIAVDPELGYVVYDLNGYLVMQTMKVADLNRLNNGLYIINGVKVLINNK